MFAHAAAVRAMMRNVTAAGPQIGV